MFSSERDHNTLMANAGMVQIYGAGGADQHTAEWVSQLVGDKTIWTPARTTGQFSLTDEDGNPMYQDGGSSAAGVRSLRPSQVRAMVGNGEQLASLQGLAYPVMMSRWPRYFEIPTLMARAASDPYHEKRKAAAH